MMEVDFSELNDRMDSALNDSDPQKNLIAMLGLYVATELKTIKKQIEKSHQEQSQELVKINKELSLLRERLNRVKNFETKSSSGKFIGNVDKSFTKKRKVFDNFIKQKKYKPTPTPEKNTNTAESGSDKSSRSTSINIQMFQSLNESSANLPQQSSSPQPTNVWKPSPPQTPPPAQRKISAKSHNFSSSQMLKEFVITSAEKPPLKITDSLPTTPTRSKPQNKYKCKICGRGYKIYWGGIIKHLSDQHELPNEEKQMIPFIKFLDK